MSPIMDRHILVGIGLFITGIIGYIVGIYVAYPGREFTITAVMVGIALAAIGHRTASRREA